MKDESLNLIRGISYKEANASPKPEKSVKFLHSYAVTFGSQ